ncbi:hypothetical protein AMAG_04765 [Allomyces macrogynus ATCC 38327]|uniref:Uncharacterized protein n=1 Tax=Allomyces macrogynus (strain ATCC 38327) TaxID=578462 RepID=A0A0L0S647_ALLM3|nr:hypothetical protein AMAG_04765 [Allomyces macrogynus ATCC 38327]|eukprot:KNE57925.1 hypothetical protein AMAG_04765 [Allomyces macrogynus ATCC 38327]
MSLDITARTVTSPLSNTTNSAPSPARLDTRTASPSPWPVTAPVTAPWPAAHGSEPQAADAEADEHPLSDEYDDDEDDLPSSLFGCPWSAQDDDDADLEEGEIRHRQGADPVVTSSSMAHPLRAVSTGAEHDADTNDNDADVEAQAAALWGRLADLFDLQQQQQEQPMTALHDDLGAFADADDLLNFLPASPTSPPLAPNSLVDPLSVDGPPVLDVNALYQYYLGPDLAAQLTVDQLYDRYVAPPESASTSTNHDDDEVPTSPTPCGPMHHHVHDDDLSHMGSTASTSGSSASMTTTTVFAPAELDYNLDPDADPDALLPDRLNWNSTLLVDSPLPRRRPTVMRARAAPGPFKPRLVMLPDGWSFGSEPPTPSHDLAAQYGPAAGSVLRSPSPPGSVLRSRGPTGGARPRTHSLVSSSSLWPAEVASTLPSPDSGELHASGIASSLASPRAGMAPVQGWWSPPPPRATATDVPARDRDRPFGPAAIQPHQSPRSPLAWEF